jgi:prophage DNA circulation protein
VALPKIDDALVKLPIIAWRGISFPIANLRTSFAQRIVQHEKPDRPGAKLEGTDRKAIVTSCTALFDNGLVFDTSANTDSSLFPDVHREFMLACLDKSTDDLLHPILGTIKAKCATFESVIDAGRRGGAHVQVSWVEHTDDSVSLGTPSPLAFAAVSATALDAELVKFPTVGGNVMSSFTSLLFQIQAASDTVSLLEKRGVAIIPGVLRTLKTTSDALVALGSATTHLARELIVQLTGALLAYQQSVTVKSTVKTFVTRIDTTLGAIASELNVPVQILVSLNPALIYTPRVPRGTSVRYQG